MARLAEGSVPFMKAEFGLDTRPHTPLSFRPNHAFVLMAIGSAESAARYERIAARCAALGISAARADDGAGSEIILREIVRQLCEAEFLIFDLSGERPNVYFELGYAFGIGNRSDNVLLLAQKGSRIHFDVAPLRVHFYDSDSHLEELLGHHLGRMARGPADKPSAASGPSRRTAAEKRTPAPWWKFWRRK